MIGAFWCLDDVRMIQRPSLIVLEYGTCALYRASIDDLIETMKGG